jgi:hypothetical protein
MSTKQLTLPPSLSTHRKSLEEARQAGPKTLKDPVTCRALKKQDQERKADNGR